MKTPAVTSSIPQDTAPKVVSVVAIDNNKIKIDFENKDIRLDKEDFRIIGDFAISDVKIDEGSVLLETSSLDFRQNYAIDLNGTGAWPVDLSPLFKEIKSDKPLGFTIENGYTIFRLFAPRAHSVRVVMFEKYDDPIGREYEMQPAADGVWEFPLAGMFWNKYYGYKITGHRAAHEQYKPDLVIADPYSRAVVTKNTYGHEAKSIILKTDYDWEGDTFINIPWQDLIIYEMHVRDLTVHPSAGIRDKGTYRGLVEKGGIGGIDHILDLDVNAVELLPCQDFGNIEIPFNVGVGGLKNTWNPYARNHWGYMTSYFFAPESYYASGGTIVPDAYNGIYGQQVNEFKDMVKAFHKEGIAVLMDVVYNHVSQYDFNPFKYIDKQYYFRLDAKMDYLSFSGCGNDFKTERTMARRMIVDSIKYWLQEYHVDGFRFDLATIIDWETIEMITEAAKKINPNVILIAEPWGGGKYDLAGFSERGWAAWNDLIRNGVKGQNPENGLGFIFGGYHGNTNPAALQSYVKGSLKNDGGPFVSHSHSINYLESHDDHTLGDFIRIGLREVDPHKKIENVDVQAKLNEAQMRLHKMAAVFLFTSQGAVMVAEGQEFARSKVIAQSNVPDKAIGKIDHNSYNKDNETNWLNFEHKKMNLELFDYYRGLIGLRKNHRAFRNTNPAEIQFLESKAKPSLGFYLPKESSGDDYSFIVLINPHQKESAVFPLPAGDWQTVVDMHKAGSKPFGRKIRNKIKLRSGTAVVLREASSA